MTQLYPLLLEAALHTKVWGGRKLADVMGKTLPTDEPYGEAWEVHDTCKVINGPLAGHTLADLLGEYGTAMIGKHNDPTEGLPLLIKILDAADWLSVQVHPNDEQAAELEGQPRGKTEAWYIIATEPTAKLIIGVEPGTDRAEMAAAIREDRLGDLLVPADIEPGDLLFIPAGTVHAIGPGTLLYEVQQSSNTTYRLYDWGRTGLDGNPRELHIEKGVQVSNTESVPTITHPGQDKSPEVSVVNSDYFTTTLHNLNGTDVGLNTSGTHFHTLTCIDGTAAIIADDTIVDLRKGTSAFVPASVGGYTLTGNGQVLRSAQA